MTRQPLPWLLIVLAALLGLRWWDNGSSSSSIEVVRAVDRPSSSGSTFIAATRTLPATAPQPASPASLKPRVARTDTGEPLDAFAMPAPPVPVFVAPPPPPPAPPVQPVQVPVAVAAPPVPQPPAMRVIGSWHDGSSASVFVAGPTGTLMQARVGDVLMAEYKVTQQTPSQIVLKHVATGAEVSLAIPPTGPSASR